MSLTFVDKKKRWPPPKPVQYALAVLVLLAAIALLVGWLYVRFIYTEPADTDTPDDTSSTEIELPDTAYCLVIIEDAGYEHFALVTADPIGNSITVTPVSASMDTDNGTPAAILQKHGATQVTQAIAATLQVPVTNFLSFSIADVQNLLTKLGENLQFTLSEEVTYRDENGATVRLTTDKRALTPKQIATILRHTEWTVEENGVNIAADLTVALINQCLQPKRSLLGYFQLLANNAYTNLRIDNYNAYLTGLEHLASSNTGELAKRIEHTPEPRKEAP